MSSVRLIGANRTADAGRTGEARPADAPSSGANFPEALGTAANSTDAPETPMSSRHRPGADAQSIPPSQIADRASHRRRISQETGGLDTASGITSTNSTHTPPDRCLTESTIGSATHDDSTGSVTVAPLISDARATGPPTSWVRPATARDTSARAASNISLAQDQSVTVDDAPTAATPDPAHALPAPDAAGRPLSDIFALSLSMSAVSLEIGADPDLLAQSIGKGGSSASGGDAAAAQSYAAHGGDAPPPITSGDQTFDASNLLVPTTALGQVQIGDSSGPGAPTSSPSGLADQLSYQVIKLVARGGDEVVLRLHPPELGDLTVRILVNGREVSAWFESPQMQVQQAISQAIGQLHTDLGNAGYSLSSAWVGADAWSPSERDGSAATPQQPRGAANTSSIEEARDSSTPAIASGVSVYV